jgi:hypothetical protein
MTEEKNLKDYLPFYIGCECQTPLGIMELSSIDIHDQYPVWFRYMGRFGQYTPKLNYEVLSKHGLRGRAFYFNEVKPLLRPLSDMTEQEFKEIFKPIQPGDVTDEDFKEAMQHLIKNGIDAFDFDGVSAQIVFEYTRLLLSKHFDIFELIPAGLAIDKTTLQTQKNNG